MINRRGFSIGSFVAGILVAIVVFAAVAASILSGGFSARNHPGRMESAFAHYALHASVTTEERSLRNPVVASAETLQEARDHFADHCASCHANNGSGHTMYGDGLNPAPPDLRLASTQSKSDGELYSIIQNGIRMSGMPAFGSPGNNDASTWKLVSFLRHLPSLTPDEELEMQKANPITPSELKEQQEEDDFLNSNATNTKGKSK